MRKILALTSIRSEYDLMSAVYRHLRDDGDVDLRLLVSGAHLSPAHGHTVDAIRADGLTVLGEIETLIHADSASARLKTASGLLAASVDLVRQFSPDVLVFAGDREDVLVAGMLGTFLGIPTAHFFSGDHAADGHIDNPIRHATSKLASTHFVSIPEHRERLLHLGEPAERIFVTGSVALDKFISEPAMPRDAVLDALGSGRHAHDHPLAVLIFHPIGEEIDVAADYVHHAVDALAARGFHVCIGAPNTDPGSHTLTRCYDELARRDDVTFYRNVPRAVFINLLRQVKLIAGNSSAGLLEAASLRIPALNIGLRQRGRLCGGNVVFVDGDHASIEGGIAQALSPTFQAALATMANPYGDGHSARKAADLLKQIDFTRFIRKYEDPLHARP